MDEPTHEPPDSPRAWRKLSSEPGPDLMIGRSRFDTLVNPRTGEAHPRFVLEAPTWVNVVARTSAGAFVMVRQYRFGTERVTIEVPGGLVDPGEDPAATARRELREETGYTSTDWRLLAVIEPNPAIQNNRCYQFLAENCRLTDALELDPGEDIEVDLIDEQELCERIRSGEINHSLVIAALARVLDLRS